MGSRKSIGEMLDSLLGLKPNLDSSWVKSVADIVKTLPSQLSNQNEDEQSVAKTKEELAALSSHLQELNQERKRLLNEFLDLKGNIRVFCRIRPMESINGKRAVTVADTSNVFLNLENKKSKSYSFDRVFNQASSQDEVFSEIEPVIKSVIDGHNACIFAYGQTGTGKTFTMEGREDDPGVVARTFKALFKKTEESKDSLMISLSMIEIYMGCLQDLLSPSSPSSLSIQMNRDGGIEIENLVSIQVNDFNQALRLYRLGCRYRSTASTNSNATSSRSHCMIRVSISCFDAPERRRAMNKIWLVDLGGSERVLKTKASGRRFDEGKAINLSLSALGDVINALQTKKSHIPYRNSKLTQVLKDSLGDDSKTLMLVHVSPKEEDLCETVCSLNFATRVKNTRLPNEDTPEVQKQKETRMANLQKKMAEIEHKQQNVKKKISTLEKRLEDLTGKSSKERDETEEQLKNRTSGDANLASMSKLPSFMRPTVSSRKKSETFCQFSEFKVPVPRRRRTTSHRAESVTLPLKDYSVDKSEHSISGASCLVTLNERNIADNATECSLDTSQSDFKFPEPEKPTGYHIERKLDRTNYNKNSRVDSWFDLQKNGISHNHRTKRITAIPMPKKKNMQIENRKAQKKFSKVESNKRLMMLNDSFNSDLRCDSIWESQITEEHEYNDHDEACRSSADEGEVKSSENFQLKDRVVCEVLQANLDGSITGSKEDSGNSIAILKELSFLQEHTETVVENAEDQDSDFSTSPFIKERTRDMLQLRSQKSLFTNNSNKEPTDKFNELQAAKVNTGIFRFLKQKLEVLLACALLGLGFYSLGYEQDFFYSLEL